MSAFTPTGGSISGMPIPVEGASNPHLDYLDATLANTEYSISIPPNVRFIRLQGIGLVGAAKLKIAFTLGGSGLKPVTVWPGNRWESPPMIAGAVSVIYVQSSKAGERIEIECWE